MIAALLRRAPRTCRSTQFTLALIVPPTNHFACGGFQSRTCVHGVNHSSSDAKAAQNASGSRSASAYTLSSRTFACERNSWEGGNDRSSCSRSAISTGALESDMAVDWTWLVVGGSWRYTAPRVDVQTRLLRRRGWRRGR